MTVIDKKRLAQVKKLDLQTGSHSPDSTFCIMEAVAYVANEPWSDHPKCACPVLTAFMISWNDRLPDADRQKLKPYIPKLVGTRSTNAVEQRRSWLACDWLVRTFTVTWLRKAGLNEDADALAALPELTSAKLVNAAIPTIKKARDAAWDAAWAAAWAATWAATGDAAWDAAWAATWAATGDAAWDAARAAAGAAARDAAWDAAGAAAGAAARAAAWAAAGDAAGAAARDAAWDAAGAALRPTVLELQTSAFDLLDRMLAVTPESLAA